MLASDLQVSLPTVNRLTPAIVAARLVARSRVGALVFADDDGSPAAVISAADLLRVVLRASRHGDVAARTATVGDVLDDDTAKVASVLRVDGSAELGEVAARMAAARVQVAVVDDDPRSPRFLLLTSVLDAVLADWDDDPAA